MVQTMVAGGLECLSGGSDFDFTLVSQPKKGLVKRNQDHGSGLLVSELVIISMLACWFAS